MMIPHPGQRPSNLVLWPSWRLAYQIHGPFPLQEAQLLSQVANDHAGKHDVSLVRRNTASRRTPQSHDDH